MRVEYLNRLTLQVDEEKKLSDTPMERLAWGEVTVDGGWLRGQMDLMCEGVTGRLPQYGPYFGVERNGFLYPDTQSG